MKFLLINKSITVKVARLENLAQLSNLFIGWFCHDCSDIPGFSLVVNISVTPRCAKYGYRRRCTWAVAAHGTVKKAARAALNTINHNAPAEITYRANLSGMKLKVQCTALCSARNRKNPHAAHRYAASTWLVT